MAEYLPDFRVGDTLRIKIQYPAGTNLTGYHFTLTLKTNFSDPDPGVLQVSTTAGSTTGDQPTEGIVYLVASSTVTAIASGKYYFDLQERAPTGEVRTIAPPVANYKDKVFVAPGVTGGTP